MVYTETEVSVIDNFGALLAKCIKIYNNSIRIPGKPGTELIISIKTIRTSIVYDQPKHLRKEKKNKKRRYTLLYLD